MSVTFSDCLQSICSKLSVAAPVAPQYVDPAEYWHQPYPTHGPRCHRGSSVVSSKHVTRASTRVRTKVCEKAEGDGDRPVIGGHQPFGLPTESSIFPQFLEISGLTQTLSGRDIRISLYITPFDADSERRSDRAAKCKR
jgi:hypothetical protein